MERHLSIFQTKKEKPSLLFAMGTKRVGKTYKFSVQELRKCFS